MSAEERLSGTTDRAPARSEAVEGQLVRGARASGRARFSSLCALHVPAGGEQPTRRSTLRISRCDRALPRCPLFAAHAVRPASPPSPPPQPASDEVVARRLSSTYSYAMGGLAVAGLAASVVSKRSASASQLALAHASRARVRLQGWSAGLAHTLAAMNPFAVFGAQRTALVGAAFVCSCSRRRPAPRRRHDSRHDRNSHVDDANACDQHGAETHRLVRGAGACDDRVSVKWTAGVAGWRSRARFPLQACLHDVLRPHDVRSRRSGTQHAFGARLHRH